MSIKRWLESEKNGEEENWSSTVKNAQAMIIMRAWSFVLGCWYTRRKTLVAERVKIRFSFLVQWPINHNCWSPQKSWTSVRFVCGYYSASLSINIHTVNAVTQRDGVTLERAMKEPFVKENVPAHRSHLWGYKRERERAGGPWPSGLSRRRTRQNRKLERPWLYTIYRRRGGGGVKRACTLDISRFTTARRFYAWRIAAVGNAAFRLYHRRDSRNVSARTLPGCSSITSAAVWTIDSPFVQLNS